MGIKNKIAQLNAFKGGVKHCTFNPDGPGVVRIHLVPPKFRLLKNSSFIVIINGYYILPIGYSWALLLSSFIDEVNKYDGVPITDTDEDEIINKTILSMRKIYPSVSREELKFDLNEILDVFYAIARGDSPESPIEKLSIRSYAPQMTAPHRMDLMISAMTDENGTWKCNQKCRFCYAAGQEKSNVKELSTEKWKKAINNLYKANVPMITFTGGEPTLREDLVELVEYSKKFVTRVNTNGVKLTKELAKELKKASLDSIQITLYSFIEEVHNELVGCDNYKETVEGIKNAVEAGLDVSINTPLCKRNAEFYLNTLEFIKNLGVRFVTVSGLICTGYAGINHQEYDISKEELTAVVINAKLYCDQNGMEIDFTSPGLIDNDILEENNMHIPMCGACLSNMAIAPDGTVIPCQSWLNSGSDLGNILYDDFKAIWNNPKCKKLRSMNDEEACNCPFRVAKEEIK